MSYPRDEEDLTHEFNRIKDVLDELVPTWRDNVGEDINRGQWDIGTAAVYAIRRLYRDANKEENKDVNILR